MKVSESELSTADGPMAVYEASPDGAARGAVVVIQEAFGVNDHMKDVTRRFAEVGYHAVAPSFFHRAGGGIAAYDDFDTAKLLFAGLDDDGILMDVDATVEHLHAVGFTDPSIGVVGWCFGGRAAFLVTARRKLGAGVTFYGGGIVSPNVLSPTALMDVVGPLQAPWLGLFGDEDTGIPVEGIEQLRGELKANTPFETEIVRYPDVGHGFHCDARPDYREGAARDAWGRTLEWFANHLQASEESGRNQ